jgi:hypothetical protein
LPRRHPVVVAVAGVEEVVVEVAAADLGHPA